MLTKTLVTLRSFESTGESSVYILILLAAVLVYALVTYRLHRAHPEPLWDWDNQDLNDLSFPENFIWGTATAAHQVEGDNVNNWSLQPLHALQRGHPTHQGFGANLIPVLAGLE